ncbi:hypothetical protein D3C76_880160 [compost metagenome]
MKKAGEAASILDNEMSSIREDILEAQKQFEDDSNVTTQVLSQIHQLYFFHLVNEAIAFQNRFNDIWQRHDMDEMKLLLDEVKKLIALTKKGENTDEL